MNVAVRPSMITRILPCLALVLGLAACNGDVEITDTNNNSSTGGAGGEGGGVPTSTTNSSSGGGGTGGTSPTTSSSTEQPQSCGGFAGVACPNDMYCDYPDNACGAADGTGVCVLRPVCVGDPSPDTPRYCGCDGETYVMECSAYSAGVDIAQAGGCTPPAGQFSCGPTFCDKDTEYCAVSQSDIGGEPNSYECKTRPLCVGGEYSCACFVGEACGDFCSEDAAHQFTITCPGG